LQKRNGVSILSGNLCRISVRVKVNARSSQVLGFSNERGVLEVALNAPPRDGEANAELIELMSELLQLPKRNLAIVSGLQSRDKVLEVEVEFERIEEMLLRNIPAVSSSKEEQPVRYTKSNLPSKLCATCGRPFNWRKKWERCWDEVRYCSDRCRNERGSHRS
jgi:uncharacterized protein (TIGR00251 family)